MDEITTKKNQWFEEGLQQGKEYQIRQDALEIMTLRGVNTQLRKIIVCLLKYCDVCREKEYPFIGPNKTRIRAECEICTNIREALGKEGCLE